MTRSSDAKQGAVDGDLSEEVAALSRRYMLIAEAAYGRAERRGFVPGSELSDWLEAEAEVDAALGWTPADRGGLRKCVADLVAGGAADLPERIRLLVVRTLAAGNLNGPVIRIVVQEVFKGAEDGVAKLGERGGDAFALAMKGVEGALSDVAEAGKLTVEEARGRMAEFARDDLHRAIDDLLAIKSLLDEVLHESAAHAGAAAQATLNGLATHARVQGGQLAQRIDEVLAGFGDQMIAAVNQRKQAGRTAVREKTGALAGMACAALRSIAERLERGVSKD